MYASVIGLAGCGKSTFMDVMSMHSTHAVGMMKTGLVTIHVPDNRVDRLAEIFKPKKTSHAEIRLKEILWPEKEEENRKNAAEKYVKGLAGAELLIHVVRAFDNPFLSVPPDPKRDLAAMDEEMVLADLTSCENFFERHKKKPAEPVMLEAVGKARDALEKMLFLSAADLTAEEKKLLGGFGFATLMQQLIILNTSENAEAIRESPAMIRNDFRPMLALPLGLAKEIEELPPDEQLNFFADIGLDEPIVTKICKEIFSAMNLISFFTVGDEEVHAWTVPAGTPALKAAGKVHSDMERGFIRAEIVHYDTFTARGSFKACRDSGDLRIEGKTYLIQDGEIMHVRFNV